MLAIVGLAGPLTACGGGGDDDDDASDDVASLDDNALSELRLRHLGFIFQSFNLIPQLTVRENIELPLYYLGWDAEQSAARADELAGRVGL